MQITLFTFIKYSGKLGFFLVFYLFSLENFGQSITSPYRLSWKGDISIGLGVGAVHGLNFFMNQKTQPLTTDQITNLRKESIPKWERFTADQWHVPAAKTSDVLLLSSALLPFLPLIDKNMRQDWKTIGVLGAETFALNAALTNLAKISFHRTRPYNYNALAPMSLKLEKDARYSFFSGHTSTVSSMSFFAAQVYSDYRPHSKAMPWVWGTAAALPALTGYLRVRAGKHFPSDVITGYLVGAACGILIPRLHRIK